MALPQVQPHRFLTEEQRAKIKRAIAELRQLLPLYEQTRDPELYAKIEQLSDLLPAEDGIPMEFFWHSQQMAAPDLSRRYACAHDTRVV